MVESPFSEAHNYLVGGVVPQALQDILEREEARLGQMVKSWVDQGLDHLFLVGCGGSYAVMQPAKYLLDQHSDLAVDTYTGWEFVNRAPGRVGPRSTVVLASHSGKTEEVLLGLQLAQERGARTLSFSLPDTLLSQTAQQSLTYATRSANLAKLLMAYMVTAHLLIHRGDAAVGRQLLQDLYRLPQLTQQVIAQTEQPGQRLAQRFANEKGFYVVGTGLLGGLAYQFRTCTLLEMQWLHSAYVNAAEMAHGPLEIVDRQVPFIFLLGAQPDRAITERARDFTAARSDKVLSFDLSLIAPQAPGNLAPFFVHIALQWFAWYLSIEHRHPLSTRRYMGLVKY